MDQEIEFCEVDPIETVVQSEESIRDSVDCEPEESYSIVGFEEQIESEHQEEQESLQHQTHQRLKSQRNMASDDQHQDQSPNKSNGYLNSETSPLTSSSNGYQSAPGAAGCIAHQDFWNMFTGLKVKQYSDQELEVFKKPFLKGWRREVVLRGTVTNSGKKIGDVYYYSPDKKTKLRSYVEMGLFLKKNSNCGLEPENFTFARQPVYKPPEEIVRHAMTRGSNQPVDQISHFMNSHANSTTSTSPANSSISSGATNAANDVSSSHVTTASTTKTVTRRSQSTSNHQVERQITPNQDSSDSLMLEGRSKRKRVAPTRFEDEDYLDNSPFKKKSDRPSRGERSTGPSPLAANPASNSTAATTPSSAVASSKTVETKVNAQGRTSIIIRTPLRKKIPTGPQQMHQQQQQSDTKVQQGILVQNPTTTSSSISKIAVDKPEGNNIQVHEPTETAHTETQVLTDNTSSVNQKSEPALMITKASEENSQTSQSILDPESEASKSSISSLTAVNQNQQAMDQPISDQTPAPVPEPTALQQQLQQPMRILPKQSRKQNLSANRNRNSILSLSQIQTPDQIRIKNGQVTFFKPIKPKPVPVTEDQMDGLVTSFDGGMVPPCSIMCAGLQGVLPNLLCTRCLCLFHASCVPNGIHLIQGSQFICPNCIQPTDNGRPVGHTNGIASDEAACGTSTAGSIRTSQPSSRTSSRAASPQMMHNTSSSSGSILRQMPTLRAQIMTPRSGQQQQHQSLQQHFLNQQNRQAMDKRQQSQLQLLQTFQQRVGIKSKNSMPAVRPQISGPTHKQRVVQKRGHFLLSSHNNSSQTKHLPKHQNQQRNSQPTIQPAPPVLLSQYNQQKMSELISHHLDEVSRLLKEITWLKQSSCQKASGAKAATRKRSRSV